MSDRWPGGFITKNPVVPDGDTAPGIWTLEEASFYTKQGTWPIANTYWISSLNTAAVPDSLYDLAYDGSGNVYVCGYTTAQNRAYVAKYNADGALQWQKTLTQGSSDSTFISIAVSSAGVVYVSGYVNISSVYYTLMAKYTTSGTLTWQRTFGTSGTNMFGNVLAIDSSENIYVTSSANNNLVLSKFDSSGNTVWQRASGSYFNPTSANITLDADGNIYTCGRFESSGNYPAILTKFNSSGTVLWSIRFDAGGGGGTVGRIYDVAVSGNTVYTVGQVPSAGGGLGILIGRFNASTGSLINFSTLANGVSSTFGTSIAFDRFGSNFYITGRVNTSKALIAKYSSSVALQWQVEVSSSGLNVDGISIATNSRGILYVGATSSTSSGAMLPLKLRTGTPQTGSYSVGGVTYTIATTSYATGTASYTVTNVGVTNFVSSYTNAASSLTDANGVLTASTTAI